MQLNESPEIVTWPEMRYVFVEKVGAFIDKAQEAWQEMHRLIPRWLTVRGTLISIARRTASGSSRCGRSASNAISC